MKYFVWLLIAGLLISSPAFAAPKACLIGIDIGHMRDLPGATSARGVTELEYNAILAERLHTALDDAGVPSVILNPDLEDMALHERPERAAKAGATLLISIHHDSTPRPMSVWQWQGHDYNYSDSSSGYSLYLSKENPRFAESLRVAKKIGDGLRADGLAPNLSHADPVKGERRPLLDRTRGIYQYDHLVLLQKAAMPALLIEAYVIVNRDEELRLRTAGYQDKIIAAVTAAAADHCKRLVKTARH